MRFLLKDPHQSAWGREMMMQGDDSGAWPYFVLLNPHGFVGRINVCPR
jgi:hypothetical protein